MPALVAGNTVVFKPASDTPHCAVLFVELLAEAGLPAGVVNLVTGSGADVGRPARGEPRRAGAQLHRPRRQRPAHRRPRGAPAEAALARAGRQERASSCWPTRTWTWPSTGSCGAPSGRPASAARPVQRVIVQEAVADALVDRLAERAAALRLGPGLDPQTDVGPLINGPAVDKVGGYAALAERDGQRLVTGGSAPSGDARLRHGHFFTPTIVDHVQPMSRLGQEEVFGPLLSIIRVPDYDAAVTALNQTPLRAVRGHLHAGRERGLPRHARHGGRASSTSTPARSGPRRTCRSAARRAPATATARPATPRSTRSPSGSPSTSTTAAACSAPRSTTSPAESVRGNPFRWGRRLAIVGGRWARTAQPERVSGVEATDVRS